AGMIFAVAWNRFLNLKHDRAAFVLAFVVPIVFFSVFALIFGGPRSATRRVGLVVVDEDSSENSRRFGAALAAEKGLAVEASHAVPGRPGSVPYDRASALAAVRGGKVSVTLVIPKGFGAAPLDLGSLSQKKPHLILYADTADPVAPQLGNGVLQKVVPAASGKSTGLLDVEVQDVLGRAKQNPTSTVLAAGLGVMFLLFSAAGAGGALIEEAESGTLDRIL